ncbi:conjugal transfer protein TrbL family protein [Nonomuraea sp. KM90]|uniref:conjugal transfer protein TrbL family protein n=1 Tax=Nonomuraea sp. KM90 TaxID=3457428 RepID=UPI003FCD735A
MSPSPLAVATVRGVLIAAVAAAAVTMAASTSWALAEPSAPPELPSPPGVTLNFGDWIIKQINSWFASLVAAAMKPALDALAVTLLATPDVAGNERLFDLWTATAAIANSAFVLLATIGAITAMGHQTVQTRYAVKEVLPRLAMAILAANTSFLLCGKAVETVNALSRAVVGEDFDSERAAAQLRQLIFPPGNSQIFYILLDLVAIILLVLLLISFVMRSALVLLLVVAAPLALAFHALPQTDGMARFWWRAFGGLLVIQVAQSLTLILAVRIFFNQDGRFLIGAAPSGQLTNLILALCLLIILVRIPSWISRRIFAQGGRGSTVMRIVKYAVISKLTAPVLRAMHLGRGGSGSGGRGGVGKTATRAVTGKVIATTIGGPAGPAAATALTAASAARGGAGAVSQGAAPPGAQGRYRPAHTGTPSAQPTMPGPQPRWQSANRRWMPPDPQAAVAWGIPDTPQASHRWSNPWSNPAQRWTPPDNSTATQAEAHRRPTPSTSRPITITPPPVASTAWVPPNNNPAFPPPAGGRSSSASDQGRRTRRPGGDER